jgi:hypothetical protein
MIALVAALAWADIPPAPVPSPPPRMTAAERVEAFDAQDAAVNQEISWAPFAAAGAGTLLTLTLLARAAARGRA